MDDTPEGISRRYLRQAAALVDCSEATAARALSGFPTRGNVRERLVRALRGLGADVDQLPAPLRTCRADLPGGGDDR